MRVHVSRHYEYCWGSVLAIACPPARLPVACLPACPFALLAELLTSLPNFWVAPSDDGNLFI
jgi:hypothetical protein